MASFLLAVKQLFVGFLVGYLAFTNTLAHHIENFFLEISSGTPPSIVEKETALRPASQNTPRSFDSSFDFLKQHNEFQRAALIASKQEESDAETDMMHPLDEVVRDALVNIYCQYKTDRYIRTTTGSGVVINKKGIILTNAHVAQFLLLRNVNGVVSDVSCVIRAGNPAEPKYQAELLYISPRWIFDNSNVITEESPRGTGERDYALLYISKTLDEQPLPSSFPAVSVDTALLPRSTEKSSVVTAGYPAESLFRYGANTPLTPRVASTTIGSLYTFGSNYADLFSISESPVGESGASGGPIVTENTRRVIGLIVTKGDTALEGEHSLRALSLSYVDRTIKEETGFSLKENTQGDVAARGDIFKKAMVPFLAGILKEKLKEKQN